MKRNSFVLLFIAVLAFAFLPAFAGSDNHIADNFNSRTGVKLSSVKGYLEGNCWFFADFDVNRSGWTPNMEGDGAMVSGTGASATEMTGIYTPLLDLKAGTSVDFKYKFNQQVSDRRWIKLYAADANDKALFLVDSVELTGSDNQQIYTYHKVIPNIEGQYKLFINYQGIGGSERIAIDQLVIGAAPHYQSTCNTAPVALKDKFIGNSSHTASGNVLNNDFDPNHETLKAYLLEDSPDGSVSLNKDGNFEFTPKPGFTGTSTHFTYKVCDDGAPSLCSINTMAVIRFPSRSSLTNFQALYRKNAVDINWSTAADNHSATFEVERSLDGTSFEQVGEVKANGSSALQEFTFTDKVHEKIAQRNDLYYRLRQVDGANRVTYSKVLIVRMYGSKSVASVSVTPDPGVNDIQVNVQLKEKSFVLMKVTDNNGSELIRKTAMGENGSNIYNIEGTDQLQPGMYQLDVIINSNEKLTMRLAKS